MVLDAEAIVRGYWERIWLERDLEALDDFVADPSTRHTVEGTQVLAVAELRSRIGEALRAVRGSEVSIDAFTLDGDRAWARVTLRGTSLATMAPMTITWIAQYRLENAKIAEMWALHQAGLDWHTT